MTVTDLIAELEGCDPEADVHFALEQHRCSLQYVIESLSEHTDHGVYLFGFEDGYLASGVRDGM